MADLVSILIPVFNRRHVIEETVRSALDQTHRDIEVVVVDNASTDGTWEMLQQLAAADARLRIFRNDQNLGPVRNWLACLAQARGRYSKILWSDDLVAPDFLERCLPFLGDPKVGFVYTAALIFSGAHPGEGGTVAFQLEGERDVVMPSRRFIEGIFEEESFPFSPGCALFRTEDLRRNLWLQVPNELDSDFSMHAIGNDLLAFLLTANEYESVALVGKPLSFFRHHAGSITIAAGAGRLVYHYDLAKAYFSARVLKDARLQRRLNARLFLHLRRYGQAPYGIASVGDFYPGREGGPVDILHVGRTLLKVLRNRLARSERAAA